MFNISLYLLSQIWLLTQLTKKIDKNKSTSRNIWDVYTFMILHWATPVTVSGTPCAVSTPSHIGFKVITSSERRWTSVTNHQAHAHPPTIVRFLVDPQHPPKIKEYNIIYILNWEKILFKNSRTDNIIYIKTKTIIFFLFYVVDVA